MSSQDVNGGRTDNAMSKRKWAKRQTIVHKMLHINITIHLHEAHLKSGVNSGSWEGTSGTHCVALYENPKWELYRINQWQMNLNFGV